MTTTLPVVRCGGGLMDMRLDPTSESGQLTVCDDRQRTRFRRLSEKRFYGDTFGETGTEGKLAAVQVLHCQSTVLRVAKGKS